jgi:hypothetical protein
LRFFGIACVAVLLTWSLGLSLIWKDESAHEEPSHRPPKKAPPPQKNPYKPNPARSVSW